jgi:RNA polymerase sigma-70 factor (ECF subfamily)
MKVTSQNLKNTSDEELMNLVTSGNKLAFSELYDRYAGKMLNFFFKMLNRDSEKARDFTQDLFIKIAEKPQLYDSQRKFSTWIYTVAGNMCKNEYRKLAVRKNISGEDAALEKTLVGSDHKEMDEKMDRTELFIKLDEAVSELDESHKTPFILRYKDELSIKEIADIMGISEGTIKSRLFYTLRKLGDKLKDYKIS